MVSRQRPRNAKAANAVAVVAAASSLWLAGCVGGDQAEPARATSELTAPSATWVKLPEDGSLATGQSRIRYGVDTHCGVEWFWFDINGSAWRATDLYATDATADNAIPSAWGQLDQSVDLILTLVDDTTLEARRLRSDVTVTYTPDRDRPGCD